MRDRDKRRCWQQILTKIGIDAMADDEWSQAYEQYKMSWTRTYCIRHCRSALIPLLNHVQQRPTGSSSSSALLPTAADVKPMHETHASFVAECASPRTPKNNPQTPQKMQAIEASNDIQDGTNHQASESKIFKHQVPITPKSNPFDRRSKISSLIKPNENDDEDEDDPDECLPLIEWQKRYSNENGNVKKNDEPVEAPKKRKRGRPSLADKAQMKQLQGANQSQGSIGETPNKKVKWYNSPLSKASRKDFKKMAQPFRKAILIPAQQQQARPSTRKASTLKQEPKKIQILEESALELQYKKLSPMPSTSSQSAANQRPGDFHSSSPLAKKGTQENGLISGEGLPMPAHMPPTAINLSYQPKNEQPQEGQKQQLRDEYADQNLDLTKKASGGGESLSTSLNDIHNDHSYIATSDLKMDEILMETNVSSLLTVPAGIDPCHSIQDFHFLDENLFNDVMFDVDQGHPVPQGDLGDSNTPTELDHQMADVLDILERLTTPPRVEANTQGNTKDIVSLNLDKEEELDYELDDDVLSVATSWEGSDEDLVQNPLHLGNKTMTNENNSTKGPTPHKPSQMPMPKPSVQDETSTETPERPSTSQISAPPQRGLVKQDDQSTANVRSEIMTDMKKVAGRIPKIKPGQLEAQPSVMQMLYDHQDKEEQARKQEAKAPAGPSRRPSLLMNRQREEATVAPAGPSRRPSLLMNRQREEATAAPAGPSRMPSQLMNRQREEATAAPSMRPSQLVNRQREEASAARHGKVETPVFGPLYQIPPTAPHQGLAMPIQETAPILQQVIAPNNWMTDVFGIRCMAFLDDYCVEFGCNHEMNTVGEVQRRLLRMDESALEQIYVLSTRSIVIFKNYFNSFAEIFLRRNLRPQVLRMISDCRLYKNIAGPLIAHIFGMLKSCGMEKDMTRVLMRDLWMPSKAAKFRDLTITILHVLSRTNWEDYLGHIIRLGAEFNFIIPIEIVIHILESSKTKNPEVREASMKLMLNIPAKELQNPQHVEFLKAFNEQVNVVDGRPRTSAAPNTFGTPGRNLYMGPGSNNGPRPGYSQGHGQMPGYYMNQRTSAAPSHSLNSGPNRYMGPQGNGYRRN